MLLDSVVTVEEETHAFTAAPWFLYKRSCNEVLSKHSHGTERNVCAGQLPVPTHCAATAFHTWGWAGVDVSPRQAEPSPTKTRDEAMSFHVESLLVDEGASWFPAEVDVL